MHSRTEYSIRIKEILDSNAERNVILINGKWGTGKTHFWNDFIKKNATSNAYVSLFGKKDINEVKTEIFLQIYQHAKSFDKIVKALPASHLVFDKLRSALSSVSKKVTTLFSGLNIYGASINSVLTLFPPNDFNDVVICFDDFERVCDMLQIDEVMGYISLLSERYGAKIVILMNEEKLEEKNSSNYKKYNKYKEKIVNYEILFDPPQQDIFNFAIKELPTAIQNTAMEAFHDLEEQNIRNVQKVARNVFYVLSKMNQSAEYAQIKIAQSICFLSLVYYNYGKNALALFTELIVARMTEKDSNIAPDDRFKLFAELRNGRYTFSESLEEIIWNFLTTNFLDANTLDKEANNIEESHFLSNLSEQIDFLHEEYLYNLSVPKIHFANSLTEIIEEHWDKILFFTRVNSFTYYIDILKEITGKHERYEELKDKIIFNFIDTRVGNIKEYKDLIQIKHNDSIEIIRKNNEKYDKYYHDIIEKHKNEFVSPDTIIAIMEKINYERSWGRADEETLNSTSPETLSSFMRENKMLLKFCIKFYFRYSSPTKELFPSYTQAIKKSIEILSRNDDETTREKARTILKSFDQR